MTAMMAAMNPMATRLPIIAPAMTPPDDLGLSAVCGAGVAEGKTVEDTAAEDVDDGSSDCELGDSETVAVVEAEARAEVVGALVLREPGATVVPIDVLTDCTGFGRDVGRVGGVALGTGCCRVACGGTKTLEKKERKSPPMLANTLSNCLRCRPR